MQRGPGWHLALLPFTDGGTGISLVTSHTLTDGGGLTLALTAAVVLALVCPGVHSDSLSMALPDNTSGLVDPALLIAPILAGLIGAAVERYGLTQALVSLLSRQPGTSPQALL